MRVLAELAEARRVMQSCRSGAASVLAEAVVRFYGPSVFAVGSTEAVSEATWLIMLGAVSVLGMAFVEWLVYRDLTKRNVDPAPVMVAILVFWPLGFYWWSKRRRDNPHPDYG